MKQTISILIIFLFLSCLNDKEKIEYKPIFFNLNPKMELNEWNKKIKNNPELSNNNFTLNLNNKNSIFEISKKPDRIILHHTKIKEIYLTELNRKKSKNHLSLNEKTISTFINIFKKKYGNPVSILPLKKNNKEEYFNHDYFSSFKRENQNKQLVDYGFNKEKYLVFQDSVKVILIGYENYGKIILSDEEFDKLPASLQSSTEGFFDRIYGEYHSLKKKFGIDLEINYIENVDFKKLLKKIKKDRIFFKKNKSKKDSINKSTKELINKNKRKV